VLYVLFKSPIAPAVPIGELTSGRQLVGAGSI
jgi:hypothetical protein